MVNAMSMDRSDFEANLAAVAGADSVLKADLLASFSHSYATQLDLLRRARCDGNWEVAAMRLKGLGASFHCAQLCHLAEEALEAAPGDPVILRKIARFAEAFQLAA